MLNHLFIRGFTVFCALCAIPVWAAPGAESKPITIDANYPGGNILVQKREGTTVYLAPDLRDTQPGQWWFYWSFRLRAEAGQPVTVVFTGQNPLGVRGPAVSTDEGLSWYWLGAKAVHNVTVEGKTGWSFEARVPVGKTEVRYAFCPGYGQSHLGQWLATGRKHPALKVETLTQSRQGKPVELLRVGCLNPQVSRGTVVLTSRHHCCETMATYALEGLLAAVLAEDALGQRLRSRWEFVALPFMDKDGVENGDQGKNRAPHDHNRDYQEPALYPEVAALMRFGAANSQRVTAFLDLHCPYIRGEWNDRVYIVGAEEPRVWEQQQAFARVLEQVQEGALGFRSRDCLAFGTAWNTGGNFTQGRSSTAWARAAFPRAQLVTTFEIAYADALGHEVNADSARSFGRDLARALADYLVP
jgi:hypothetical protein